jgi:hypothetical protein
LYFSEWFYSYPNKNNRARVKDKKYAQATGKATGGVHRGIKCSKNKLMHRK